MIHELLQYVDGQTVDIVRIIDHMYISRIQTALHYSGIILRNLLCNMSSRSTSSDYSVYGHDSSAKALAAQGYFVANEVPTFSTQTTGAAVRRVAVNASVRISCSDNVLCGSDSCFSSNSATRRHSRSGREWDVPLALDETFVQAGAIQQFDNS